VSTGWFQDYELEGWFDEAVRPDGELRDHYRSVADSLGELDLAALARAERRRDAAFRTQGITFTVYGDDDDGVAAAGGIERTFPMDLVPRVIPADEWSFLERGLVQRVTALNRFLDDLYVGGMQIVKDGVVPRWLLISSDGFTPEAFGVPVPLGARCLVAGIDVVRDEHGDYRVLEDNLRCPSGISYVVENRAALTRVLPQLFAGQRVQPVDQYGPMLLHALQRVGPPAAGEYHVKIGHGRSYDDVQPLRGVYLGPGASVVAPEVEIRRVQPADLWRGASQVPSAPVGSVPADLPLGVRRHSAGHPSGSSIRQQQLQQQQSGPSGSGW
jgi:uncharacterized circularly permuted ATP-grasp superfamily protein